MIRLGPGLLPWSKSKQLHVGRLRRHHGKIDTIRANFRAKAGQDDQDNSESHWVRATAKP